MRHLLTFLLLSILNVSVGQTLPNFDEIKLDQPADYKAAETSVTQAANYIVSTPFDKNNMGRLKSLQLIIKWMTGTPDYSFNLGSSVAKITKKNEDLLGIYMACMTKYCLENKESSKDNKKVSLNSMKLLLNYCSNPDNNIKMTKELKKLVEADQKGELEKELE